jgi:1-carboxybiuret hydrolase
LQGPDNSDPVCAGHPVQPTAADLAKGRSGLRIAVAEGYFRQGAEAGALAAVDRCAALLGVTDTIIIPEAARARAAAFLITNAESSALHLDRLRTRAGDFDPETRDRFLAGAMLPAAWVVKAQRFRRWYHDAVLTLFRDIDVILAPATPCAAPRIGQKTMLLDGQDVPVRPNLGIYTQPISFIGLPVAAVPATGLGPLPYGVQVIAAPWREDLCLRIAAELENAGIAA